MGYFGNQTYGTKERKFIGKPLEQIASANQILTERYDKIKQQKRDLQNATEAIKSKVEDVDKPVVDKAIEDLNNRFKETVANDSYEQAGTVLADSIDAINKNLLLKETQNRRAARAAYEEELQKSAKSADGKGGKSASTINYGIHKARLTNNKAMYIDENGEVHNRFNAPSLVDDINWTDKVTDLVTKFRANTAVNSNSTIAKQGYNDGLTNGFISYVNKAKATGATEGQLEQMAMKYLANTPEYIDWAKQEADKKMFYELNFKDGSPVYDADGNLTYSNIVEDGKTVSDVISKDAPNNITKQMYETYKNQIEHDKSLNKVQKAGKIQDWINNYSKLDNDTRAGMYKQYIMNNVTGGIVDYAGEWANYGVEREMSNIDWEGYRLSGNGGMQASEVITANDASFQPTKIDDIKTRVDNKSNIEKEIQTITQQIGLARKSGQPESQIAYLQEELSRKQNELSNINSTLNENIKYARNENSDYLLNNIFDKIVNHTGMQFDGVEGEDTKSIITKYQNLMNYYNNDKSFNSKYNKNFKDKRINDLREQFINEMYPVAIKNYNEHRLKAEIKDIRKTFSSGMNQVSSLFDGVHNSRDIGAKNIYYDLWRVGSDAKNTFEKTKQDESVRNNTFLASSADGTNPKDSKLAQAELSYSKQLNSTDMIVAGTDKALSQYVELDSDNFITYDGSGKPVNTKVNLDDSKPQFGIRLVNGKAQMQIALMNGKNQIYDNRNSGDGKPRPATVTIEPANQTEYRIHMYKAGEQMLKSNNPATSNNGLNMMMNARFGDITAADPESLKKGEPRTVKVVDPLTNNSYTITLKGEGKAYMKGKIYNRFSMWYYDNNKLQPFIPKTNNGQPIVNKDGLMPQADANIITSEQDAIKILFNSAIGGK